MEGVNLALICVLLALVAGLDHKVGKLQKAIEAIKGSLTPRQIRTLPELRPTEAV